MAEPDLSILKSVILRLKMEIYGSTKNTNDKERIRVFQAVGSRKNVVL